ncbi:translation initiation factor IF-2 [Dispira parvispora]|uniref:Translation initiation factor IF-2, mitochondrial n=1 Tax=Dispira parvispora TaxID=1520584 RepID=A0A9W8ATH8_9FUNG|nr:translation initiation factor IF-2 [Dispira parvispora]
MIPLVARRSSGATHYSQLTTPRSIWTPRVLLHTSSFFRQPNDKGDDKPPSWLQRPKPIPRPVAPRSHQPPPLPSRSTPKSRPWAPPAGPPRARPPGSPGLNEPLMNDIHRLLNNRKPKSQAPRWPSPSPPFSPKRPAAPARGTPQSTGGYDFRRKPADARPNSPPQRSTPPGATLPWLQQPARAVPRPSGQFPRSSPPRQEPRPSHPRRFPQPSVPIKAKPAPHMNQQVSSEKDQVEKRSPVSSGEKTATKKKTAMHKYVGDESTAGSPKPASRRRTGTTTEPDSIEAEGEESHRKRRGKPSPVLSPDFGSSGTTPHRSGKRTPAKLKKVTEVVVPDAITVSDLANLVHVKMERLIHTGKGLGMGELHHDYVLNSDETTMIALELDINPVVPDESGIDVTPREISEDEKQNLPLRPPIVTIMGHVDHGKTTLLDALRKSSLVDKEYGGITQHIGAFSVNLAATGQKATVLDTPGHAAFSNMRYRGSTVTDIVILVVAADDGVMPQTIEAIRHAQKADVPLIVAINKCDKPGSNPQRVMEGLLQHGIQVEDLGGDVQAVQVSALKGAGIDLLVENVVTLAEVLDLRAPLQGTAEAVVLEAQTEKGRGMTASLLVRNGTLRVGDYIVAGTTWCKVRSMLNDVGKPVKEAGPGIPVKALGWHGLPSAGDVAIQVSSDSVAKKVIQYRVKKSQRSQMVKEIRAINTKRASESEQETSEKQARKAFAREVYRFYRGLRPDYPLEKDYLLPSSKTQASTSVGDAVQSVANEVPVLRVLIKGDVAGTVEAVVDSLQGLPQRFVRVEVVSHGVGPIVESDVQRAHACAGVIIGFNVKSDKQVAKLAQSLEVRLETYRVIYKLLDDARQMLLDRLEPEYEEHARGEARVQKCFTIDLKRGQVGHVAGCRITSGIFYSDRKVRVLRQGKEVYYGKLSSLRSGKDVVNEVGKGLECGISFGDFKDFQEGDTVLSLEAIEKPRKLE